MKSLFSKILAALTAFCACQSAHGQVVISQYYEGLSNNKYIEIQNIGATTVNLDNYYLSLWSNGNREIWKSGGTPGASVKLTGVNLPPGGFYLFSNVSAAAPVYAANNANMKLGSVPATSVINFNGDDSIVLYDTTTNALGTTAAIVDAFSVTASNAADKSYYRLSNNPGFDLVTGNSSNLTFSTVWGSKTNTEVDNAGTGTDSWKLEYQASAIAPTLLTFVLGADAASSPSRFVSASFTASGDNATDVMISESPLFTGAIWTPVTDAAAKRFQLSTGNGTKTVYFKAKNSAGESSALSDTIDLSDYIPNTSVVISQYYEGLSNDKYVEISNLTNTEIQLTGWNIGRWTNETAEDWKVTGASPSATLSLSGLVLPPLGTVIVANNSAATPIAATGLSLPSGLANGNISHTGNDSLSLYNGAATTTNLVDVASFTNTGGGGTGEGMDKSFVRLTNGIGFDFALGSAITSFPTVWKEVALATVNAAVTTQNEYLGTYPGSGPSGYAAWAEAQWPGEADTAIVGFEADPDADGIKNGAEYSFVLDPKLPSQSAITVISTTTSTLNFSHKRPKLFTGVTLTYQWSPNLSDWAAQGEFIGADSITTAVDSVDTSDPNFDVVQAHASISEGEPKKFFIRGHAVK